MNSARLIRLRFKNQRFSGCKDKSVLKLGLSWVSSVDLIFSLFPGFSSKHSNIYSSFYYQEYRLLQGTSLVAEEWGLKGGGWEVLNNIFNNGFIFFNVLIVRFFFSKIIRIVRFFRKLHGLYGFFYRCTDFFKIVLANLNFPKSNTYCFIFSKTIIVFMFSDIFSWWDSLCHVAQDEIFSDYF